MAIGTLMKKIQRHELVSDYEAADRRSEHRAEHSRNYEVGHRIDESRFRRRCVSTTSRPTGTIMAPPKPCSTREMTSSESEFERARRKSTPT